MIVGATREKNKTIYSLVNNLVRELHLNKPFQVLGGNCERSEKGA